MVRSRLLSFRKGHRVMPYERQSFLSEVRQMPSSLATAFSGRWKYFESSSSFTSLLSSGPLLADAEPKTLLALWIAIATAACGLVEGGGKEMGGAGT
jgi:hypothetical protein